MVLLTVTLVLKFYRRQIPGEALIKTGAGTYGSNVTKTREANSIVKTDAHGQIDLVLLALNGNTAFDVDPKQSKIDNTRRSCCIRSNRFQLQTTRYTLSQETHLDLVEQMPTASTSNDAGSGVNTTPAIASDYIYAKTIEDGKKGSSFTGIVFGASSTYIDNYDDPNEGKIGLVAAGTTQ